MNRSLPALDRRRFLATAGSGAALAAAGVVTAPTSGAAHAQTSTGAVDVITVDGAIPGIPYRTRTSILDVAEYARRAQVNSAAFTNAWTRALQRLAQVPAPADSPASGKSVNWRPNSGW
ncbi:twin-arginine translocation signal domain-containing protein [Microbacterium testaceum]|uniref:twin-arginine translocation signal domain-containing protein n=1 Tax=Microbacterium testaceum TaxID=2033 RepID=UPI00187C6ABA|nr:twin-arginine translocation signal domain-containing protein [Microbacterium testaceum]